MALAINRAGRGRYTVDSWRNLEARNAQSQLEQQFISTQRVTVVRCVYRVGSDIPLHSHPQEQITIVEEGQLRFLLESDAVEVRSGEMISIAPGVSHATLPGPGGAARALNLFLSAAAR